jgi:hypothetical protein
MHQHTRRAWHMHQHTRRAVTTTALLALLAAPIPAAHAVPAQPPVYRPTVPVQRVGLTCYHKEYLIWGVRYCVTLRARKDRLGQWEVQPAAAVAGYNRDGRRAMRFLAAVRLEGHGRVAGPVERQRLVVRGAWAVPESSVGRVRATFVLRWPNGRKSALRLYSRA